MTAFPGNTRLPPRPRLRGQANHPGAAGLSLPDVGAALDVRTPSAELLDRRFNAISTEIAALRGQQAAVLALLRINREPGAARPEHGLRCGGLNS